ncbi:hypothetical protein EV700_0353 [Fluviicoccus keumensis]|uniref:Uncharacterized protein n=2 Tax=Fluviicoccus keumensis TaxID=1435465 RepID=A0A4Q7Z9Z4_9GAMM|nr:hypothetical protein EV700_0353 [Fluviicoccus keumensis]
MSHLSFQNNSYKYVIYDDIAKLPPYGQNNTEEMAGVYIIKENKILNAVTCLHPGKIGMSLSRAGIEEGEKEVVIPHGDYLPGLESNLKN